jgi:hypothetical protein
VFDRRRRRVADLLGVCRPEYDRGVNTFSPEGRLLHVDYAIKAMKVRFNVAYVNLNQGARYLGGSDCGSLDSGGSVSPALPEISVQRRCVYAALMN